MSDDKYTCPDCGLDDHPHQTCAEANMSNEEIRMKMNEDPNWLKKMAEKEDGCDVSVGVPPTDKYAEGRRQ